MPVSTTDVSYSYHPAAGMLPEAIPFQFLDPRDLAVTHVAAATGVRTLLIDGYAIAGDGRARAGRITAQAVYPAGDLFVVTRQTACVQQAVIKPHEPVPADDVTQHLDRMVMVVQEQAASLDDTARRALTVPRDAIAPLLPDFEGLGGKLLRVAADGRSIFGAQLPDVADPTLRDELAGDAGPRIGIRDSRYTAGPVVRIDDAFAHGTRLTRYGWRGDGSALDTQAWRDAIVEAGERNIGEIIVPHGQSIVDGDLLADVDGRLPAGLSFRGEGRGQDSEFVSQSSLIYLGDDVCWNIRYPTGGPAITGRWRWQNLTFRAPDVAATMFSFNDPVAVGDTPPSMPTDADPYQYLIRVAFEQCFAYGANGAGPEGNFTTQTGDFLRASKVFHLAMDALTSVLGWRRGVWLRGCDNCHIASRFVSNVRAVMIEEVEGFFANENRVTPYSIAGLPNTLGSSEPSYLIWDRGKDTVIGGSLLFEAAGATAHMYLNGHRTLIEKPVFGVGAPMFHLGPLAQGVTMMSPDAPVANVDWAPIVDAPASPSFGSNQLDYRMRVYDAPLNMQLVLQATNDRHGRIQVVGSPVHGLGYPAADEAGIATSKGYLVPVSCRAGGFWGDGGIGGLPIEGIVHDPAATGGQAIKIGTGAGSGFGLQFRIGKRIMPAAYKVSVRNRLSAAVTAGTFLFIATKNGGFFQLLTLHAGIAYGRPAPDALDLTGFAPGDVLALQLYNNGTGLNAWVDYVDLTPVAD